MNKTVKDSLRNGFLKTNALIRDIAEKNPALLSVYDKALLPALVSLISAGNYKLGKILTATLVADLKKDLDMYLPDDIKNDKVKRRKLEKDIAKSYFTDMMTPDEYLLYHFDQLGYWERREFLSDLARLEMLNIVDNKEAYVCFTNKAKLYEIAKQYFKREACAISKATPVETFVGFASSHPSFFLKPIDGSTGRGASVQKVSNEAEARKLFAQLVEDGTWFAEELIKQNPAMAQWNESCVNTLRLPTFRTKNGCRILQPYMRTGRVGAVVDNAGQGGVFAVFDPETGVITTDGVDEFLHTYAKHPDSGLKFKGWQIPEYEQLKALASEIIYTLPFNPKYAGLDFALTNDGWVLVEGNYNGQFVGQIAEQKGVRKQFIEYFYN